jgi:hypothetical protein
VLQGKFIGQLHHANTVTTSCTFLQLDGLASRGHITDLGLQQTPQPSDSIDQKFGVWYDVFMDTVDIHARASKRNLYGPVLFILDVGILKALPPKSEVLVTKKNPIYWDDGDSEDARFFTTPEELETFHRTSPFGIKGTFGLMVVIRTQSGILSFPDGVVSVVVDDPERPLSDGTPAFPHAISRIKEASRLGGTHFAATKRICRDGCICLREYGALSSREFDQLFL